MDYPTTRFITMKNKAMPSPKARILYTENDSDTRELIVLVLSGEGFEVVCPENPGEALSLARAECFDLYLVDSWMPGLSGDELTRRIREFDSDTPILFYSAAAQESDKESARASGAQGYLVKPAGVDELVDEVGRLIAEAKTTKAVEVITAANSY
jgi:DNA-binding response OmpR family regulator